MTERSYHGAISRSPYRETVSIFNHHKLPGRSDGIPSTEIQLKNFLQY